LRIEDGGSVTSSSARVGGDGGGTSIVTISGDGSTWDVVGDVSVGQMGKGVLTIEHGGKLSSGQGLIADFSEAIGEVTVTGAGSNWSNAGQLLVGAGPVGAGTLGMEGGGTVDNTIGYIGGDGLGSVGTVTVSGKESVWKNTGNLYVSYQGNGTLSIEDGGTVRVANVMMADAPFVKGVLAVTGTAGARGMLTTGRLFKGAVGDATVTFGGGILQATRDEADFLFGFSAGDVTIDAGGVFIDSNGYDIGIGSALGGIGSLTKMGAGTLTLTGANTYTGGTAIDDGTLQIGDGGTTGSIKGDVTNNAALIFNRSNLMLYQGNISGTGTVEKKGADWLILIGANTYTGGTTISEGTLQIGDGSTLGSIVGDVTNNAALVFTRSDALA